MQALDPSAWRPTHTHPREHSVKKKKKKKGTECYNDTLKHLKCYTCAFSCSVLTHCGQLSLPYQNVSVTAGRDFGTVDSCCKRVCTCLHLRPSIWAVFAAPLGFCINMLGSLRREQECMQSFHTLFFLRTLLSTCDRERGSIVVNVAAQHYKANVKVLA